MTAPSVARGIFIGEVSKGERKTVGESTLVEFYLDGFGLRFNAWKDLSNKVPGVGSTVMVEGVIKTRTYQVEGHDRQTTEVTASSVERLDGTKAEPAPPPPPPAQLPEGGF